MFNFTLAGTRLCWIRCTYTALPAGGESRCAAMIHSDGDGLLFGQLLRMFQQNPFEFIFGAGL